MTRRWLAMLALVAAVAAVWAVRLGQVPGEWLWNLDLPKIDYPLASFYHEALGAGRLPLWNDRLGLGFPLYAEGQIGAFYPPNWLLFRLPPLAALDASRVLHLAWAGVGAGLLVLRAGGSRSGSVVAALVAILGGAITAKLEWHNLVAAYAWLPWVLLPLARRPAPTRAGLVVSGVLFGVQALAGHPNTWLLTGIAAAAALVARPPRLAGLGRAMVVGGLGSAVGAVQLMPTALLATLSVRGTALTPDDLFAAAATPFDILGLAFQGAFARVVDGTWNLYTGWYPDGTFAMFEAASYVGLPVVALAAAGARTRRAKPFVVAIGIMVAIPVIEAFRPGILLGVPLVNALRSPTRAYLVATLLLGVVAGIAVGRPVRRPERRRALVGLAIPVGAYVATLGLALLAPTAFDAITLAVTTFGDAADVAARRQLAVTALTAPWPLVAELAAGAGLLAVLWVAGRRPEARRTTAVAIVGLVAVPLALFGPAPNGTAPAEAFSYADSDLLRAMAAAGPHRVVTIDPPGYYAGMPDQPAAAGIADLRMFSSLNLQASDEVADAAARDTPEAAALRRALGVDVVVTFGVPCPGTEVATSVEPAATVCRDEAALRPPYWIPFEVAHPGSDAPTPIRPRGAALDLAAVPGSAVPLTPAAFDVSRLEVDLDAPRPGWVWIDRAWWPGWITTVDGARVDTVQALGGTLVPVAAGAHRIAMTLVPWDALVGLAAGIVALAGAVAWMRRAPRRVAETDRAA